MADPEELSATHRATYDDVAARFAVANAQMPPAVLNSARQLLEIVGLPARILDLGCGHGRDAAWFEAQGAEVVAADLSAGMLTETRLRVTGPVVQLDMRALAFRPTIFDGVWSNAAILHLPRALVGEGETWEAVSYAQPVARFFSRYATAEFGALIEDAGMRSLGVEESYGGPRRHWAHYFARRD